MIALSLLVSQLVLYLSLADASRLEKYQNYKRDEDSSRALSDYPLGCSPLLGTKLTPGLSMELYEYPLDNHGIGPHCWDPAYLNPEYPRTGFESHKLIGTAQNVMSLNFEHRTQDCHVEFSNLPASFNFPDQITLTNFTMLLYGYFKPKESGRYRFHMEADDLLLMNLGAGNAFDCCAHEATRNNLGDYIAYDIWAGTRKDVEVFLEKEVFYPLRLFFNNRDGRAALDFSYYLNGATEPGTDIPELLFSLPDGESCPAYIGYENSCRSINTTTTYSTSYITTMQAPNVLPITSTIYYVATPCADVPETPSCQIGFWDPINSSCYTSQTNWYSPERDELEF